MKATSEYLNWRLIHVYFFGNYMTIIACSDKPSQARDNEDTDQGKAYKGKEGRREYIFLLFIYGKATNNEISDFGTQRIKATKKSRMRTFFFFLHEKYF